MHGECNSILAHPVDVWAWPGSGPRCCWRCSNVSVHQEGGFCESNHHRHTGRNPDTGQQCGPETPLSYWPLSHTPPSDTDYTTDLCERNMSVANIISTKSLPLYKDSQSHSMLLQHIIVATSFFFLNQDKVSFYGNTCYSSTLCACSHQIKEIANNTDDHNCACGNQILKYR